MCFAVGLAMCGVRPIVHTEDNTQYTIDGLLLLEQWGYQEEMRVMPQQYVEYVCNTIPLYEGVLLMKCLRKCREYLCRLHKLSSLWERSFNLAAFT